ncbi:NAD-dependent epimerase/dehydratase family protein [Guggenheimella bovis]
MIHVLGGSGFVGRNLVPELEECNVISRNTCDYSLESLKKIFHEGDTVIHLAAERGAKDYKVNVGLTERVIEASREKGVKKIIFASSISVYSDESLLPWNEDQRTNPFNPYGVSKRLSEMLLELEDFQTICLRFGHIFGANEENDYMINRFLRQSYNHEKLILFGEETAKREMLYVKDAVRAILLSLTYEGSGIFNIGSGNNLTNKEIAVTINEVMDNPRLAEQKGQGTLKSSFMDSTKAKDILGYTPKYSFKEAVEDIKSIMDGTL